jgi:hypothetical protein
MRPYRGRIGKLANNLVASMQHPANLVSLALQRRSYQEAGLREGLHPLEEPSERVEGALDGA